ncbi:MAG: peptidase U32, partial [Steroidobacteraceae bacterium]|nr:peptidase U32 [Deltaproteobacteria bacterium]
DPSNYLRSEFIRPEDLDEYVRMGFTSFKILERGAPTSVMAQRVRAYSEGRFDGNLLDLIQPYGYKDTSGVATGWSENLWKFLRYFFRPGTVNTSELLKLKKLAEKRGLLSAMDWDPVHIDNRKLDGFLAGIQAIDCRTSDCSTCGYCADWTRKAVTIDSKFQSEMLALYADAFGSLYSGRFWGVTARTAKKP